MLVPMSINGFITLSIGLFDNDESPVKVALIPSPDKSPSISLIPVPELPKSKSLSGILKGWVLLLRIILVLVLTIDDPIRFRAFKVEFGS